MKGWVIGLIIVGVIILAGVAFYIFNVIMAFAHIATFSPQKLTDINSVCLSTIITGNATAVPGGYNLTLKLENATDENLTGIRITIINTTASHVLEFGGSLKQNESRTVFIPTNITNASVLASPWYTVSGNVHTCSSQLIEASK